MIIPILKDVIISVRELQQALEDGVISDSCGNISASKAHLDKAEQTLLAFEKKVEAGLL